MIKRNLLYWGRVFENLTGSMFLGILVYMLVMSVLDGGMDFENPGGKIIAFIVMFLCICAFVTAFQALNVNFPLTISMGSTRKASFIGMEIMLHGVMAQWCLLAAFACLFLEKEVREILAHAAVGMIAFVVILMMLANLMCVFAACFGKTVGVIAYVICICLAIGVIIGTMTVTAVYGVQENQADALLTWLQQPLLLLTGIVADAIVMFVYYKVILKYNY